MQSIIYLDYHKTEYRLKNKMHIVVQKQYEHKDFLFIIFRFIKKAATRCRFYVYAIIFFFIKYPISDCSINVIYNEFLMIIQPEDWRLLLSIPLSESIYPLIEQNASRLKTYVLIQNQSYNSFGYLSPPSAKTATISPSTFSASNSAPASTAPEDIPTFSFLCL